MYNMSLPYGDRLSGHTITVINRSEVVGRPLAALLANDGASVYSVDINDVQHFTRGEGLHMRRHTVVDKPGWKQEDCLLLSDVVISGVPGEFKVPTALVKSGAVCINFSSDGVCSPPLNLSFPPSIAVAIFGTKLIAPLLLFSRGYFSSRQNFTQDIKEKASVYVPTIGKVTIVILLRNLLVSGSALVLL